MKIIITMGGLGSRFRKAGYNVPKYMIEVNGKTLFTWSMVSLNTFKKEQFIFIVRVEDKAVQFISKECENLGINDYKIIEIEKITRGQAETVLFAMEYCNYDEEIFIYNIDTYVEAGNLNYSKIEGDGFIPCFNAEGEHWSFVRLDENNNVVEIREKNRISDNCTIGAYYFRNCKLYTELYNELYNKNDYTEAGEQYIAPMYNLMLKKKYNIKIQIIDNKYVHVLGTPEEVEEFRSTV